jgi:hypothetical protein
MNKMKLFLIVAIQCSASVICAQEILPATEQQLENLSDANEADTEDDVYLQQLEQFRRNPVDLNTADAFALRELRLITDLQAAHLMAYRKLFGNFVSLYELQAVPLWDIITIRKLLPFVMIGPAVSLKENLSKRFKGGDHTFLLRASQILEKSKGFANTQYPGSPQRVFFRYRYTYKNLLQFGIVGDKDAGEQFFKGVQHNGFDFYSFHLFARKTGIIHALAIGDFTVNMGQGLIQWQSLAFKKSSDITGTKRQSPVLMPYNSAGEFNFHRGAGITIGKKNIETTVFASMRMTSAHLEKDSSGNERVVSSFLTSGYHRTDGEIADRNSVRQIAFGSTAKYNGGLFHIAVNGIYYGFSSPVRKRDEPYNMYALSGDRWYNGSIDYSFTWKNFHFFGEAAADKNFHSAYTNGVLISADPCADISFLYRAIGKEYQAVAGNAFTENTYPANESGLFAGITIRPATGWRLDMYGDMYRFPWLKYLADAPGYGKDLLVQATYTPDRQTEIYGRYRTETKQGNDAGNAVTHHLIGLPRQNLRLQINYKITAATAIRNRIEMGWYDKNGSRSEKGFLTFFDIIYKPLLKPFSGIVRLQYFETEGYNSRLYAYENDVLYSYSIPAFFDKGYRCYLVYNHDVTKKITVWLRWAQTIFRDKKLIGSGMDEIPGNKKSEMKIQFRYIL